MTSHPRFALVTGASSGLGREFARQLAATGYGVVLVARNLSGLEQVASELGTTYGVPTEVLAVDLHEPAGRAVVASRLATEVDPIRVLVNNAGYGISGNLAESDHQEEKDHLSIHVSVPLELTQAALPGMLARGDGRVVLVSSVAGYLARGTYSAHKAWGLTLARSLSATYKSRGVVVTAVAPGFTRTEFHQRMKMNVTTIPEFMWLSAERVVSSALRASEAGRSVVIPSLRYKALVALAAVVPRTWHQSGV
jgi:short-subunit dehydrogenase